VLQAVLAVESGRAVGLPAVAEAAGIRPELIVDRQGIGDQTSCRTGEAAPAGIRDPVANGGKVLEVRVDAQGREIDNLYDVQPDVVEIALGEAVVGARGNHAAVRPVIRHFTARRDQLAGLDVLLGFKTPDDILFRDDIEKWKCDASIRVTVDKPADAWSGAVGVITTLVPEVDFRDINETEVIVVGPPLMMKFTVMAFLDRAIPPEHIWVSYERRMSCGVGKCGHCKIHDRYVCLDGPVFNYAEARWLQD